jgi:2-polyprenyl-3-methyl-5-hydroxy-6-metoxy-1,4-benzoquinol methylase
MHEQGLLRLNSIELDKNRLDYIVLMNLITDLKSVIRRYSKASVLDIGCGNKPYEILFQEYSSSYTGCDVVQSSDQKVDVICEATALQFAEASFDTVFSTQVIEHVADPFQMIAESYRVLKPGGHIIVSAPLTWELHEEPYDFFRYTKYGLKAMFEKYGFTIVELKPNGGKWAALIQLNLNIIYSTFKRKSFLTKVLKGLFINLRFTALINRVALWLDRNYFDDVLTLNYVIVAQKPA